jgi:hypothetical protein
VWTFLSFLVCSSPSVCFVTVPQETPFAGLAACQIAGTMMMPTWEENHKGYHIAKVRCTMGKKPHGEDAV